MPGFTPVLVALALAQSDAAPAPAAAAHESGPASTESVRPERGAAAGGAESWGATATATSTPTSTSTSEGAAPVPAPAPVPRVRVDPAVERAEAERVARSFVAALAAGDPAALAAAASDRSFSFDGDLVAGRDPVRARWRALLAGRPGPAPEPGALEVLLAQEALGRHGPPPARLAPLARPGAFVAIADVGGRTVVLFLGREGGRMAVLGMHD